MKILAINGSPRKGKNTALMLQTALEAAAELGTATELLELSDFNLRFCTGCNACLRQTTCAITDDDNAYLHAKMLEADGIILGSPCYFGNVTALMKNFMDRTRCLHMVQPALKGKVGGAVTHAGLRHGGQEHTLAILERFLVSQGLILADGFEPFEGGPRVLTTTGVMATMYRGMEEGKIKYYRSVTEDELAMTACRTLGQNMVKLIQKLQGGAV
ncbi:MAG TPA: flavodoxin family protein [Clostridia bacterium]|nr:flavodoxin family protein [Clostridia bacterium]